VADRREHNGNDYDRTVTGAATPAIDLVARSGIVYRLHAYASPERHARDRDRRPSYGTDAAVALGLEPARVFKTLVASVDDEMVLAVLPVDRELDLKRLALARSGRKATLVDPVVAQRATGGVIGGISPLGSRRPLPVVVDASASRHQTVFVSAGRRGLQLELAPADLVRLSSALLAPVARDHGPG
jgi:Cys-tRNA(Pro)/Cys-tRNA(Cys) deacylase